MELGQKLRQARLEAGLSQRQLCADQLTRNMLSQIENGSARPSMDTLRYLASRLGKSVSYFLEEDAVVSPNRQVMDRAREAFDGGDYDSALAALEAFRAPDDVYEREAELLEVLSLLEFARQAMEEQRFPYARELLDRARERIDTLCYPLPLLQRRRLLLLSRLRGAKCAELAAELPSIDDELLLRAKGAMEQGDNDLAGRYLDVVQDQCDPRWGLLRGQLWMKQEAWDRAARCFHLAEEAFPRETALPLERCYRELGDFRQAYNYACLERSFLGRL